MVAMYIFLVVLGLAVIAFAAIWYNRGAARHRAATQLWTRGDATIEASSYRQTVQQTAQGTIYSYQPVIRYRYGAAAEREGTRPFLNARQNLGSEKKAQAWVARYPAGAKVPVWWDPADPSDSALELNPPARVAAMVLIAAGVFALVMGVFLLARTHHGG